MLDGRSRCTSMGLTTDNTGNSKSLLYKNLNFDHEESVFITKDLNLL